MLCCKHDPKVCVAHYKTKNLTIMSIFVEYSHDTFSCTLSVVCPTLFVDEHVTSLLKSFHVTLAILIALDCNVDPLLRIVTADVKCVVDHSRVDDHSTSPGTVEPLLTTRPH